jgi:hypothetical protein
MTDPVRHAAADKGASAWRSRITLSAAEADIHPERGDAYTIVAARRAITGARWAANDAKQPLTTERSPAAMRGCEAWTLSCHDLA